MKQGKNSKIIYNKKGEPKGISLGLDYYTEHECGIGGLHILFGIDLPVPPKHFWCKPSKKYGAEKRRITSNAARSGTVTTGNKEYFYIMATKKCACYNEGDMRYIVTSYIDSYNIKTNVASFWQEDSFLIIFSEKNDFTKEFETAFKNCDIIMYLNEGLTITILSKEDDELLSHFEEVDRSNEKLDIAVEKTNVKNILKKSNKLYFALSPKWKDDNQKEILFWLNPFDQENCNAGWFSVEELIAWTKNTGPVLKNK